MSNRLRGLIAGFSLLVLAWLPVRADVLLRDGFEPTVLGQIAIARASADGVVDLSIRNTVVTALKPAIGDDAAGFFIQDELAGPALFVAVDPTTLVPAPAPGDGVSFDIVSMRTAEGRREVAAITGFQRLGGGRDLAAMTQIVDGRGDLVSAVGDYESELVSITGVVAAAFSAAGTGFVSADFDAASIVGDPLLRLRLPTTIVEAFDLGTGCVVGLRGVPLWRRNAEAQPSAFDAGEIQDLSCPPRAQLRLSEMNANIGLSRDLVELVAVSGGRVQGIELLQDPGGTTTILATLPALVVSTGDVIVVHLSPLIPISETTSKSECVDASCYGSAWDVRGNAVGITYSSRVIGLRDPDNGLLQDAVAASRTSGAPPAAYPDFVLSLQAQGHWLPSDCGGTPCTYNSTPTVIQISANWEGLGNLPAGDSLRRVSASDTNMASDWAVGAQSFGLPNP